MFQFFGHNSHLTENNKEYTEYLCSPAHCRGESETGIMHKSKLIKLLKTLNKDEFRHLGKFLKSPYFNTNEDVIRLYEYLRDNNHYPRFDSTVLNKEYVDKKLFRKDKENYTYIAKRIRDCMAALSILVQEFMLVEEARNEVDLSKDLLLLKSLSRRNIHAIFEAKTHETIGKLANTNFRDIHYFQTMFELRNNYFFHPDTEKLKRSSEQINEVMENLDAFYILTKLKLSCEIRSRQNIVAELYEIDLLKEVIEIARHNYQEESKLFPIYSALLELFTNGYNELIYNNVKAFYFDALIDLPKEEQKIILQYLINITYNTTDIQKNNKLLQLYKEGIKNRILILNERITPESYSNIVILGSKLGEFDWTYQFMADYEKYLDESIRHDTKLLSMAYWYFNQSEYDKTLSLVEEQEVPGKLFLLRTRALVLRAYFEKFLQDESFYGLLLSNAESFRKQLDRDNLISDQKRMAYKNFIKYTSSLAKLIWSKKATFDKRLEKLKSALEQEASLNARAWLLEKTENL